MVTLQRRRTVPARAVAPGRVRLRPGRAGLHRQVRRREQPAGRGRTSGNFTRGGLLLPGQARRDDRHHRRPAGQRRDRRRGVASPTRSGAWHMAELTFNESYRTHGFVVEIEGTQLPGHQGDRAERGHDRDDRAARRRLGDRAQDRQRRRQVRHAGHRAQHGRQPRSTSSSRTGSPRCSSSTATSGGSSVRRNGAVIKLENGEEVLRFAFYEGWVKSSKFADLEAGIDQPVQADRRDRAQRPGAGHMTVTDPGRVTAGQARSGRRPARSASSTSSCRSATSTRTGGCTAPRRCAR